MHTRYSLIMYYVRFGNCQLTSHIYIYIYLLLTIKNHIWLTGHKTQVYNKVHSKIQFTIIKDYAGYNTQEQRNSSWLVHWYVQGNSGLGSEHRELFIITGSTNGSALGRRWAICCTSVDRFHMSSHMHVDNMTKYYE